MNSDTVISAGRVRACVLALLLAGVAARGVAVWLAPLRSYVPDHVDTLAWSEYAFEHGSARLYDFPMPTPYLIRESTVDGGWTIVPTTAPHEFNYPPLSAYVFWFQGAVWHLLDSDVQTRETHPDAPIPRVTSRVLNTPTARAVQALPACLFDIPLALGVAAIVACLRGAARWGAAEIAALGIAFLAPPIVLDSAFWGQADSWIACWMVWTVHALLRRRLLRAGVLLGLALLTKPQAILLAPALAYWLLSLRLAEDGSWPRVAAAWKFVAACIVTGIIITLPFLYADRDSTAGSMRWFQRSYLATIGAEAYDRTTLNAFNIWWLDWLSGPQTVERLASDAPWLGATKKRAGLVFLAIGVAVSAALAAWRRRFTPDALVIVAALTLLAAFVLPTAVHERYIYYCLPFYTVLAAVRPKLWALPLMALLIVATGEMTSFLWTQRPMPPPVRMISAGFAVAAAGSLVYSWIAVAFTQPAHRGRPA